MKLFKKVLAGVAVAAALATSAQAVVVNVGGVVWDTDTTGTIADNDFTGRYEFNQWFTTAANAVPNVVYAGANYANAINPTTVAIGDVLQGVGEVIRFNGVAYGDPASVVGGQFCPTCELTFTFGGFSVTNILNPALSNGWLRIYVDNSPDFDITSGAAGAAANAADGVLFLELTAILNNFTNDGTFASGSLFTYYDVTDGIAQNYFDTNTQLLSSDLLQSASATFGSNAFIATATGQIVGDSVAIPEPESLALVGLGLLGLAISRRRKSI